MTPVDRVQPLVAKKLISYNGMLYTESQYERIKNAEKQHKEETDALMKKAFTPEIVEAGNDMADEHNKEMKEAAEEMNNKLS
jgi:hypothetical protein